MIPRKFINGDPLLVLGATVVSIGLGASAIIAMEKIGELSSNIKHTLKAKAYTNDNGPKVEKIKSPFIRLGVNEEFKNIVKHF